MQSVNNMARILYVVLAGLLVISPSSADDIYNVNDFLDGSLSTLAKEISASGDITARLEDIRLGNYVLRGGRLADMTTLRRLGDSWMWNDFQTVVVNGSLTLKTMFLAEAQISGPQDIPDPLFTVRNNSLDFTIRVTLDTKASCKSTYDLKWTSIDGVTLYSENPSMNNVDVSQWTKNNLNALNEAFVIPVVRLFEFHLNMCKSKWLNKLEMIKYNIDAEEMQRLNMMILN